MDNPDKTSSPSLVHKLLIEPEYRKARHLLLILILMVAALNQAFMTLIACMETLGYCNMLLQALFTFSGYLFVCYLNFRVLIPRYLLKKRYIRYTVYIVATVFLLVIAQTMEERTVLIHCGRLDGFYTWPRIPVTILSSFVLVILCISGGAMTILLRHWIVDNRKMNQLEKLHIQSEVEQLKEQVNPHLLFNILNRTGILAIQNPREASDMLIKLSQLLRYQLYDCNRDRVLLSAEIKFLNNYLVLEQMYSDSFEFDIRSDRNCSHFLVSPLLFISFVQAAVIRIYELNCKSSIHIRFETTNVSVIFVCHCGLKNIFFDMDFSKISRRLELLYRSRYSLTVADHEVTLTLEI